MIILPSEFLPDICGPARLKPTVVWFIMILGGTEILFWLLDWEGELPKLTVEMF